MKMLTALLFMVFMSAGFAQVPTKVTTLFGFDLTLDYNKFNAKYADQIKKCQPKLCTLKDNATVAFNDKLLISEFTKVYSEAEAIAADEFNEKLAVKTGIKLEAGPTHEVDIPLYKGRLVTVTRPKKSSFVLASVTYSENLKKK